MENQDEKKTYENLFNKIKMISLKLRNSIDRNDMRQVLKFSVDILSTLKNNFKSVSLYNQLFSNVIEEISPLKIYFQEEINRGRRVKEFFEAVQQCITVLPRLYLMIIVGNIYSENCKEEKKVILDEILKMLNGAQYPVRGFMVRYYFLKIFDKNLDDIDILLENFKEMNKLWIRIGCLKYYLGSDGVKARNELKEMIGDNIAKLANIPDLNSDLYKNKILFPLLKIIIECGDYISQEYILLKIIDLFPDELNIKNIDIIITSLGQMKEKVDIKEIFIKIMEKLGNFNSVEKLKDIKSNEIFEKLNGSIEQIIQELQNEGDNDNDILKVIELEVSYLKFIINFGTYEEQNIKLKNINKIITKCYELISKACGGRNLSEEGAKIIFNLLQAVLESPFSIFKCKNFPDLMGFLNDNYKNQLSLNILDSLVNKYNLGMIDSKDKMESIIEFISPMVDIEDNKGSDYLLDKALNKISKLVFMPYSKNPFEHIEMMQMLKELLINSTDENEEELKNKKLILYYSNYINALLLIGYSVIESYLNSNINEEIKLKQTKIQKDFCNKYALDKFDINNPDSFSDFYQALINEITVSLSSLLQISSNMSFKLYCQLIILLNKVAFSFININSTKDKESKENNKDINIKLYEENIITFITKILSLFTEGKIDQQNKFDYITFFIGCISIIKILDKDNLVKISEKIIKIVDKIPKKNEQCLSYINCSKLYFNEINKDLNKISELLKKAKKTAVFAMTNPENTILFIYILNEYLRYDGLVEDFDKIVKIEDANEIIEAINNYLMSLKADNKDKKTINRIDNYYKNTKNLINSLKNNQDKENKFYKLFMKINFDDE